MPRISLRDHFNQHPRLIDGLGEKSDVMVDIAPSLNFYIKTMKQVESKLT